MQTVLKTLKEFSKERLKPTATVVRSECLVADKTESTDWVKTASGWVQGNRELVTQTGKVSKAYLEGTHSEKHGSMGLRTWGSPALRSFCAVQARPGYDSCEAHEYEDLPDVMQAKAKLLAALLTKSRCTILYTGAGISTASGIPDYATRTSSRSDVPEVTKILSPINARPTKSHRILVALYRAGLIKGWVQQNHDGLPQKAGLPQSAINGEPLPFDRPAATARC